MLEMGVASGGSTRLWYDIFGVSLRYTGFDKCPECVQFSDLGKNIKVLTGSQLNKTFMIEDVCKRFGPFDFVVDDGGHTSDMVITSFESF